MNPWLIVIGSWLGAALLGAVAWSRFRRPTRQAAAPAADQQPGPIDETYLQLEGMWAQPATVHRNTGRRPQP